MKPPVYCIIDIRIKADHVGTARKVMRSVERQTRSVAGCIQYHYLQDINDPTVFTSYGIWATNSDLERHYTSLRQAMETDPERQAMIDPAHPPSVRMLDRI